jgi:diguanylate cyclase (GGDEF)-like protein
MKELSNYYQTNIEKKEFIKLLIVFICIVSIITVILINLFYFSKIQKYIKKVEHLNIVDPMTGLYNRRFLENFIEKLISQAQRQEDPITILMIDIDFFKKVNDTYGHDVGDRVITTVAEVLQKSIRKSDLAIRYGGEEFMLLLHSANHKDAYIIAQKIKDTFESIEFHSNNEENFHKTLSIGISEFPKDADSIWECIKLADKALYVAKTTGRNKIVTYSKKM